ncbi:transposon Tf2-6 polyprotein [Trichonephila clavipes]|nr:transposon Tf2-6 polyprotein [Trichonephila clavipes]
MYVVDHTLPYLILELPELSEFNLAIDCSHLQIKQNGSIISEDQNVLPQIVIENRCELREILYHYDSIFSKDKYDVGQLRIEPQRIILKSDLPVHLRPYRTSPIQEKEIKGQVENYCKLG